MRARHFGAALVALAVGPALPHAPALQARDFGQAGPAWAIAEPDLLSVIQARLERAKATGELDRLNARFAQRAQASVVRPAPVAGVTPATGPREWDYDPAITIDRDVRDAKGALIAARGQRVNPLNMVTLPRQLLFINGDSADELAWARAQGDDTKATVIMVAGSPFERMRSEQRRFFFDQGGSLTAKFGIEHTPAYVRQKGDVLLVGEVALKRRAAS